MQKANQKEFFIRVTFFSGLSSTINGMVNSLVKGRQVDHYRPGHQRALYLWDFIFFNGIVGETRKEVSRQNSSFKM